VPFTGGLWNMGVWSGLIGISSLRSK